MTRRPVTVSCDHQTDGNAHWLDLSHDGYHAPLGAKWTRRLYFGADGEDLRGQELIDGERNIDFAIRFHIHPDVTVTQDDEDIILQVGGTIWRFRQRDGVVRLENDVYLGRGKRETCRQIIITPQPVAEVAAPLEGDSALEPEKPAAQKPVKRTHQSVTWLLERIPE